jgi:hypothetical protein
MNKNRNDFGAGGWWLVGGGRVPLVMKKAQHLRHSIISIIIISIVHNILHKQHLLSCQKLIHLPQPAPSSSKLQYNIMGASQTPPTAEEAAMTQALASDRPTIDAAIKL